MSSGLIFALHKKKRRWITASSVLPLDVTSYASVFLPQICVGSLPDQSCLLTGDDSVCPATRFLCRDDSYCIPRVWLCDGEPDCHDSSDEVNCHGNCTGFQCKDKECIPEHWHCDLNEDCEDGTDELGCGNLTVSESSNSTCDLDSAHFLCRDGQCLPPQKVCDGKSDCKDGDDEASFCSKF